MSDPMGMSPPQRGWRSGQLANQNGCMHTFALKELRDFLLTAVVSIYQSMANERERGVERGAETHLVPERDVGFVVVDDRAQLLV